MSIQYNFSLWWGDVTNERITHRAMWHVCIYHFKMTSWRCSVRLTTGGWNELMKCLQSWKILCENVLLFHLKSADCLKEAQSSTQTEHNVSTSPAGASQAHCCSHVLFLKKPGQTAAWLLITAKQMEFSNTYSVFLMERTGFENANMAVHMQ